MKVSLHYPMGSDGWTRIVEMPAIPRIGDQVDMAEDDDDEYGVHVVVWTPFQADYDAYVVVRKP